MVIERGEIYWTNLPEPRGSSPGYGHPILIVQSNNFNRTKLNTVVGAVLTTNLRLAEMPGNVLLEKGKGGLSKNSVVNVTQIVTIDKNELLEYVGSISAQKMEQVDEGLRLVLSL